MKKHMITVMALMALYGGTHVDAAPAKKTTKTRSAAKTRSEAQKKSAPKKAPKEIVKDNVFEVAQQNKDLSTFVELVELAKLKDTLETSKNVTLFAPTNKAFKKFKADNPELFNNLDKAASRKQLANILRYHMLSSQKLAKGLKNDGTVATKLTQGNGDRTRKRLMVSKTGTETTLIGDSGGATIVKADIVGGNGVIQQIDDVLVPDNAQPSTKVARK